MTEPMTDVANPTDARSRIGHLSDERRAVLMRRLADRKATTPSKPAPAPRPPSGVDITAECSHTQRRVWLATGLAPHSSGLHVTTAIRLTGRLDVAALQRAVSTVVARHDGLRTVADDTGPAVRQRVLADAAVEVRRTGTVESVRAERFDLRRGPLFRVALLEKAADHHVLVLVGHHFVMDGAAMGVVVRELAAAYTAAVLRTPVPLPPHAVQYPDVSAWQWDLLGDGRLEKSLGWWRDTLAGLGDPLDLPLPKPDALDLPLLEPDAAPARAVGVHRFPIAGAAARPLRPGGVAPGLLAVYTVLLARYTGRWDQVVGMFVAGRTTAETASVVGNFTNLVAVRTDLTDRPTFTEATTRVRAAIAGALAHQDAPFEAVVATAGQPRVVGRPPVAQVAFNLHNHAYEHASWHGLDATVLPVSSDHDDLDLTLVAVPVHDGTVHASFEYPAEKFAPEAVEALGRHLTTLGTGLHADPDRPVSAVLMLPADELATLHAWGRGPGA